MTNEIDTIQKPPINQYTLEQFESGKPFEDLFRNYGRSPGALAVNSNELQKQATAVGFKKFTNYYKQFEREFRNTLNVISPGYTEFSNADMVLDCGNWECVDWGISRNTLRGKEIACPHPIMPVERLVNVEDDDNVKYRLAYMCSAKTKKWKTIIVDRPTISSARSIASLSRYDISVTSTTASALVDYLNDVIHLNYDSIPERKSVSRFGYIKDEGFSPYVDDLVFDGDQSFKGLFNSVSTAGSMAEWQHLIYEVRRMSVTARILLAASFASPLLSVVGSLPFFVHLWGVDSGTGKTVALMLAASVWGNPAVGSYTQTFNGTQVGQERTAAFLNHLPMCLDELQLTKNSKGQTNFDVYQLAQGVGRARGKKTGGVEMVPTWSCCFLTTGESPLTSVSSGAGAVNRVIDIECTSGSAVVTDGHRIVQTIMKNYGHPGRRFIEKLYESESTLETVRSIYGDYFKELCEGDSTEKQAASMAVILTADFLAAQWVYGDKDFFLDVGDIRKFMASKTEVSAGHRAYDWLCDWVSANANRFIVEGKEVSMGEVYGKIENEYAFINRSIFNKVVTDAGFDGRAVLSYLKSNNLIRTRGRANTIAKKINGVPIECVALIIPVDTSGPLPFEDEIPL